jgi:hypothetical protein
VWTNLIQMRMDASSTGRNSNIKPVVTNIQSLYLQAVQSALMSDYNFRGITQSNHKPSVAAYFEPRYNITDSFRCRDAYLPRHSPEESASGAPRTRIKSLQHSNFR